MLIRFGPAQREDFLARVRRQGLDEELAAREAERLSLAIGAALPAAAGVDVARTLLNKIAGYNVDMHGWVIRAMRAMGAADDLLNGAGRLEFELPDLLLGEYFLLEYARSRGVRVATVAAWDGLVASMIGRMKPRCETEAYEPVEVDLTAHTLPEPSKRWHDARQIGAVFVASMTNYLRPLLPVIERLIQAGRRAVLLTPGTVASDAGIPDGVEIVPLEAPPGSAVASVREMVALSVSLAWRGRAAACKAACRLGGVSLWPLVCRDVEHMARVYVPYAAACDEAVRTVLARTRAPTLVVARLRRATELSAAMAARDMGVRIVMIPHGHIGERPTRRFIDGEFALADCVAVWGPHQRERARSRGARAISETGNPAWDSLATSLPDRVAARRTMAAGLGLPESAPWFCIASQPEASTQLRAVCGVLLDVPGCCVLIRPHPAEAPDDCRGLCETYPDRVRLVRDAPLSTLLAACDACLTHHSTVNLESLLCGTPVVTCAFGALRGVDRLLNLEEFGLPIAFDAKELETVAREVAADPGTFVGRYRASIRRALDATLANHSDGGAAVRLIGLLDRTSRTWAVAA